jgi:hypothetical protein
MHTWQFGIAAVICWALFGYKLGHLCRDPRNLFLATFCLAVALVAIAVTASIPAVLSRLERATGVLAIWAVVPIVLGCAAFLLSLQLWAYPTQEAWRKMRRHLVVYVPVVAAMIVLGLRGAVDPRHVDISANAEQPERLYGALPYVRDAMLLYTAIMTYTETYLGWYLWRHAHLVNRRWLRRGLRLLGLGSAIPIGSYVILAVLLAGQGFSIRIPAAGSLRQVWPLLTSLGALTAAVGGTMPSWGPRLDCMRAYHRLESLWLAVSRVYPDILLDPPGSVRLDRWNPWHINYRLYRRVIEIRDGWLALRPYMTPVTITQAPEHEQQASLDDQNRQATITAATLHAAIRARTAGRAPHQDPIPDNGMGGHDLATEIAWLVKVADKFSRLPGVAGISQPAPVPHPLS